LSIGRIVADYGQLCLTIFLEFVMILKHLTPKLINLLFLWITAGVDTSLLLISTFRFLKLTDQSKYVSIRIPFFLLVSKGNGKPLGVIGR
jgi:hypothetical protein